MAAAKKAVAPNETKLVEAAVRCFKKFGVGKSFIEDIAREAGVSRQTAYRTFSSRKVLLEQVTERSIRRMESRLSTQVLKYETFAEALVLGLIDCTREAKKDKIFIEALDAMGSEGRDRYILNPTPSQIGHILTVWGEVVDRAERSGELREGLTRQDVATAISWMLGVLLSRNDLNDKDQTVLMCKFLLPTLVSPQPLSRYLQRPPR